MKILLDTGDNVSGVTESFAKKLRLKWLENADLTIDVQGIGKSKVETTTRAMVKVTLGWDVVYEFELSDEFEINLIKSARARKDTEYGNTICEGPTEAVDVASRLTAEFRLQP
ncbi:hypothetical protein PR001_g19758 [Phytophthora rubi]|nr:hypothetical protein PR001_g19758 [Phytophthora rubi]